MENGTNINIGDAVKTVQDVSASAHLISAAPDLLAALEDIVALAENQDFWLPRNWLLAARAAIAKAEGVTMADVKGALEL